MITHIDIPFCVGLLAPGLRYHWAGGATGPYGDTLDAVRIEQTAPQGEALLTQKPVETDVIHTAIMNCVEHPTIINWGALTPTLSVSPAQAQTTTGVPVELTLGTPSSYVVLADVNGPDSVAQYVGDTLQFVAQVAGTYTVHVFDAGTFNYGRMEVVVS